MNIRSALFLVLAPATLIFGLGCERKPTPPSKSAPTSSPSATNSDDLTRYLEGQPRAAQRSARDPQAGGTPSSHPSPGIPPPPPPSANSDPTWDVPAGWTSVKPSGSMRRAQYTLPRAEGDSEDGELIVFYFGQGQGGTVDANLARWRGQVTTADGQPVPASDVKSETFDANGMKVTLQELTGRYDPGAMPGAPVVGPRDNYRMLAAVVETPRGPWFFKATAPKATMDKHADAFRTMLRSVRR